MIKICDAIMGAGKSQSAISYMNDNPEKKFIYLSPYCSEAARIRRACPRLEFVEPGDVGNGKSIPKIAHTRSLLSRGKNIASTHAAFGLYSEDMIELIREKEYTLILDESLSVLAPAEVKPDDIKVLEMAGCIKRGEGMSGYTLGETPYESGRLDDIITLCKRNNLIFIENSAEDETEGKYFCWELHLDVLQAFSEVIILTYLWEGQELKAFLDEKGMAYEPIGIRRCGDRYEFAETMEYWPEYVGRLDEMIRFYEVDKYLEIGEPREALSASWYMRRLSGRGSSETIKKLKKGLRSFVRTFCGAKTPDGMYTYFKRNEKTMKMYGIGAFVPCNMRATNEYGDRTAVAYMINIFMNPYKKRYLSTEEHPFDEDAYALSMIIQWVWRSAIRNGQAISLYIPSKRMRDLFKGWMAKVGEEYRAYRAALEAQAEGEAAAVPADTPSASGVRFAVAEAEAPATGEIYVVPVDPPAQPDVPAEPAAEPHEEADDSPGCELLGEPGIEICVSTDEALRDLAS